MIEIIGKTKDGNDKVILGRINGKEFKARFYWHSSRSQSGSWQNDLRYKLTAAENRAIGKAIRNYEKTAVS